MNNHPDLPEDYDYDPDCDCPYCLYAIHVAIADSLRDAAKYPDHVPTA